MNKFHLGDTDFGINLGKSFCSIDTVDGVRVFNIEVHGDDQKYTAITENEGSEWSWTLYPPKLYIHEFPLIDDAGVMRAKISRDDLDQYEIAIYLMEHNDVDGVELSVGLKGVVRVCGTVFLSGRPYKFSVMYSNTNRNA